MMTTAQLVKQYLSKRLKTVSGLLALPINKYYFDVFSGNGFEHHSVYYKGRTEISHVSGMRLTPAQKKELAKALYDNSR